MGDKSQLFAPITREDRLHPSFRALRDSVGYLPARRMMEDVFETYTDLDGNFVEQFQSTGYDSRVWELYLHAYLEDSGFERDLTHASPDFNVEKWFSAVCVEAVTVNPTQAPVLATERATDEELSPEEFIKKHEGLFAIKFGSSLYSKLKKEYWKLPHVAGRPLVFAIEDFHQTGSMTYTGTALMNYLYGFTYNWEWDETGELLVKPVEIGEHTYGEKRIPSGFFNVPGAESVSAVLFSASGTISKFGRMGFQKGYRPLGLRIIRRGTVHNHDPNSAMPHFFAYQLGETDHLETWAEGLSMFHNPRAACPVDRDLFPHIAHHRVDEGLIKSVIPPFHPYASHTLFLMPKPEGTAEPGQEAV